MNWKGSYAYKLPSLSRIPSSSKPKPSSKIKIPPSSISRVPPSLGPSPPIFEIPKFPPEISKIKLQISPSKIEGAGRGFFVVMREFGKEVKITAKPMTRTQAELMGRDIAKQSLSASYKVVPQYLAPLPQAKRVRWAAGEWVSPFRFEEGKSIALKGFKVEKLGKRIGGLGAKVELKESKKKKRSIL